MNLIKIITKFLLVFALISSLFSATSSYDENQGCCCCDYDLSIVCECLIDSEEGQSLSDEVAIIERIKNELNETEPLPSHKYKQELTKRMRVTTIFNKRMIITFQACGVNQ